MIVLKKWLMMIGAMLLLLPTTAAYAQSQLLDCDGNPIQTISEADYLRTLTPAERQAYLYPPVTRAALPGEIKRYDQYGNCDCSPIVTPVELIAPTPDPVATIPAPTPVATAPVVPASRVLPAIATTAIAGALAHQLITSDEDMRRVSVFGGLTNDGKTQVTNYVTPNAVELGHQVQETNGTLIGVAYDRGMTVAGKPVVLSAHAAYAVATDYTLDATAILRNGNRVESSTERDSSGFEVGVGAQADLMEYGDWTLTGIVDTKVQNFRDNNDGFDHTSQAALRASRTVTDNLAAYGQLGVHHTDVFGRGTDAKAQVGLVAAANMGNNFRLEGHGYAGQYLQEGNNLYGLNVKAVNTKSNWSLGASFEEAPNSITYQGTDAVGNHRVVNTKDRRVMLKLSYDY